MVARYHFLPIMSILKDQFYQTNAHKYKVIEFINNDDIGSLSSLLCHHPKAVNAKDNEGRPVLLLSLQRGRKNIAALMITKGAHIGRKKNNIHKSIIEISKKILKAFDLPFTLPCKSIHIGESALEIAIKSGYFDIASELILRGVSISMLDSNGWPLLVMASFNGNVAAVQYLIENGASPNQATYSGHTALIKASQKGHIAICELLVKAGADVRQRSQNGFTALMAACIHDHSSIINFLCKYGADVHSCDKFGKTCLHYSIQYSRDDITRTLIRYGADIYALDYFRQKALEYATSPESALEFFILHIRETVYRSRLVALLLSTSTPQNNERPSNIFSKLCMRDPDAWRKVILML